MSPTAHEIWELLEGTPLGDALLEKYVNMKIAQGKEQELEEMMVKRAMERGIEQGLQVNRANLLNFVETHFPAEFALAKQQVGLIVTLSQAQELTSKLFVARTDDEVQAILLSIPHA